MKMNKCGLNIIASIIPLYIIPMYIMYIIPICNNTYIYVIPNDNTNNTMY